jgi:hypothetical protein
LRRRTQVRRSTSQYEREKRLQRLYDEVEEEMADDLEKRRSEVSVERLPYRTIVLVPLV